MLKGGGVQNQASLLVIGSYFLTTPSPPTCSFSLIGVQRQEPAELIQTPQSAPLKQDAITSRACQDDSTVQSLLCSGLSPRSGFDKEKKICNLTSGGKETELYFYVEGVNLVSRDNPHA